jgi:hypothetical protein
MSETDNSGAFRDTSESVKAALVASVPGATQAIVDAATVAKSAAAAPADEMMQILQNFEARIMAMEQQIGLIAPTIQEAISVALPVAETLFPAAAPILSRVPAIEHTLGALLTALGVHFGGKLAGAPTAIAPVPTPPARAAAG